MIFAIEKIWYKQHHKQTHFQVTWKMWLCRFISPVANNIRLQRVADKSSAKLEFIDNVINDEITEKTAFLPVREFTSEKKLIQICANARTQKHAKW